MNIQLPDVSRKDGYEPFDACKIYSSLIRETSLTGDQATFITKKVLGFIYSSNLKFLSGPLIREITNVMLLQFGYEKQRLENTRIGFPRYELKKLLEKEESKVFIHFSIVNHIEKEFEAVKKLIKEREQKE